VKEFRSLLNESLSLEYFICILWIVTDETASNCERFISENGLDTFVECLEASILKLRLLC
jgi:hypothetical protein